MVFPGAYGTMGGVIRAHRDVLVASPEKTMVDDRCSIHIGMTLDPDELSSIFAEILMARPKTMDQPKTAHVHWHEGIVTREHRAQMLGHRGATLWFTGLSGSGKSTIAVELERTLTKRSCLSYRLDGDNIRLGLNNDLGFSAVDRTENIRRIGELSKLFVDAGLLVLSSFISPYRKDRDRVRELHETADMPFIEIFVDCALEEAEKRDPKGLYKKARAGEIKGFTGVDDPYERPKNPELHLRSDRQTIDEEVDTIVCHLMQEGILPCPDTLPVT